MRTASQTGLLGQLLGDDPAPQEPLEQAHDRGVLPDVEPVERLRWPGLPVMAALRLSHLVL
jgi:hypothetical protein